ncbi:hypothetical protein EFA46_009015 [Halarchaeum sp. CBA1220]|uniref:hypothetical protein n=1 Tax=Halarchaeum sp. CBA1220 TaxID=1853682 RepID=UPI000F6AFEA3|nr:hypothetical protein [Halarchaeum sp. CBA1220]QLC34340.1 hypothetical protein EFA46_009015 [Halarchaeum sp. CBA1220]
MSNSQDTESSDSLDPFVGNSGIPVGIHPTTDNTVQLPLSAPLRALIAESRVDVLPYTLATAAYHLEYHTNGPAIILDYEGTLVDVLPALLASQELAAEPAWYHFRPPERTPAIAMVNRRSFDAERPFAVDDTTSDSRPPTSYALTTWDTKSDLASQVRDELIWYGDFIAAGRNPPEASLTELERVAEADAAAKQTASNPEDITSYTTSSTAHNVHNYLNDIPRTLSGLSNVETSTFDFTDAFESQAYVLIDVSDLSPHAQSVFGAVLGWKLYTDLRGAHTSGDEDAAASLVINRPPTMGEAGLPSIPKMASDDEETLNLHVVAGIDAEREYEISPLDAFDARVYPLPEQGDCPRVIENAWSVDDTSIEAATPTGDSTSSRLVLDFTDTARHPAVTATIVRLKPGGYRAVEQGDFDQTHVAELLDTAKQQATPYTVAEASDDAIWTRTSNRPAITRTLTQADETDGWVCDNCGQRHSNYLTALTCHDPALLSHLKESTSPGYFGLPAPISDRRTTTGHKLGDALQRLHDRDQDTSIQATLELLDFIRTGGWPMYLKYTTSGLLDRLQSWTDAEDTDLDSLVETNALSRRKYFSLTTQARDRLETSLYVDDLPVYGSTTRHNAALRDVVEYLKQRDSIDYVLAPYFGRPSDNQVDAAAFDSEDNLQIVANVLIDEPLEQFNPLVGGKQQLYVLQNSNRARRFLNVHHRRNPHQDHFTVTDTVTGDYSISQLRNQFLDTDPNAPLPITTHRNIEDKLS